MSKVLGVVFLVTSGVLLVTSGGNPEAVIAGGIGFLFGLGCIFDKSNEVSINE